MSVTVHCHKCHKSKFLMKATSVKEVERMQSDFLSIANQMESLRIKANNISVKGQQAADKLGFGKNVRGLFFDLRRLVGTKGIIENQIKNLKTEGKTFFVNMKRLAAGGFRAEPTRGVSRRTLTGRKKPPQEGVEKVTAILTRISSKINHDSRQGINFLRRDVEDWKRTKKFSKGLHNRNLDKVNKEYNRILARTDKFLKQVRRIRV